MISKTVSVALVTGASSGIGEALSRLLASKGISLIICGRNEERLKALSQELSVPVTIAVADLGNPQGRKKVIDLIHREIPDLVVNNAGFGKYGDALSSETKEMMEIMEVNGMAVLELTLEAARALIEAKRQGVILNVSSVAAFQIFPKLAVYAASKSFVQQVSESLDEEMRGKGVRVLTACPGMVDTDFRGRAGGGKEKTKTMTSEFAAEQIWYQIERRKQTYIFNWPYRFLTFLTRYLLPKRLVAKILNDKVEQIMAQKEITKTPHA